MAPLHYQILNNLGGIAQQRGDLQGAIATYGRAIELKDDFVDAWSNLGLAYIAAKRIDEAVITIEKAIALEPSDPSFYYDLGEAHSLEADADPAHARRALWAYETFLQRWPRNDDAALRARERVKILTDLLETITP